MKIVFLDAATMGDVSFEPFERLGEFIRYEKSTYMHILSLVGGGQCFDESVKSGLYSRSGMFTDPNCNWWELAGNTIGIIGW